MIPRAAAARAAMKRWAASPNSAKMRDARSNCSEYLPVGDALAPVGQSFDESLMRLLLFAGFLGSGKTTLILALAREAALQCTRVCVLVNEVGEVGIDGEVLRLGDMEVVEITGGCICCQIGVDLVRALRELEQEFRPDLVIVEASGIATPEGVLDTIRQYPPRTLESLLTVSVVDPVRFEALYEVLTPLIDAQIAGADRIVITKADEAAAAEVAAAKDVAAELAPTVPVFVVDSTRPETLTAFLASVALSGCVETGTTELGAPDGKVRP